jgi:hypothetical protein
MAVLAVCVPYYVNTVAANTFSMNVSVAGVVSGNLVNRFVVLQNVDAALNPTQIQNAIRDQIRAILIAEHGYVFGGGDTVVLAGGS